VQGEVDGEGNTGGCRSSVCVCNGVGLPKVTTFLDVIGVSRRVTIPSRALWARHPPHSVAHDEPQTCSIPQRRQESKGSTYSRYEPINWRGVCREVVKHGSRSLGVCERKGGKGNWMIVGRKMSVSRWYLHCIFFAFDETGSDIQRARQPISHHHGNFIVIRGPVLFKHTTYAIKMAEKM